jgi:sugar (glycoside-pentoside-hexuronide) transporter
MKTPKLDSMGNERLPFLTTFLLGSSGFMWTINFMMIQTYLLFVYTDVFKISAGYVAVLFLATRIVDAILAPAFGIFVDGSKTRWGKYKPYFIILGVPLAISGFFTFTDPSLLFGEISGNGKLIYATITYVIFSTLYSISGAATGGVQPLMTKSLDDRINIGQVNAIASMVGGILIASGVTPFIIVVAGGTSSPKGWMTVMAIISVITIVYNILAVTFFKEKYLIEGEKPAKLTANQMVKVIFKNRTALIALALVFGINLGGGMRSGAMLYYFQYYFHKPELMAIAGLFSLVATVVGAVLCGKFTKKFGMKKTLAFSSVLAIVSCGLVFFAPQNLAGIIIFMGLTLVGQFANGLIMPVQGTMLPLAMDFAEWKYNISANGFIGSFVGFIQTFATAVSGALVAAALAYFGYKAGPVQNESTILGLRLLLSIVPAILQIFMMAVLWFDLTEDKQKSISTELKERRDKVALS